VVKFCVTRISAVAKPRTAVTATTSSAGFLDAAAFGAYGTDGRSRCGFAGLHAFRPPVINISVAESSAVLEPSTPRSATTDSAGFLERATLWARNLISDH